MNRRVAVVLFNLGGPASLAEVGPFLFRLFCDPAIIGAPAAVRYPLAALIALLRTRQAKANYAVMGGASPLMRETEAQRTALEAALTARAPETAFKVVTAMRYTAPTSAEAARAVEAFAPDEVVLLPLYPQYSATTTGSSKQAWEKAYRGGGKARTVCCYPASPSLVKAHAAQILAAWIAAGRPQPVRLLFSAHGLPVSAVQGGDPYQSQVEASAEAIAAVLGEGWDWRVCYQSRVGPMKWLGPYTVDAIAEAVRDGRGVVIAPIAFVSEHVETLVELDRDYRRIAEAAGCRAYVRVPALGVAPEFIGALADSALGALERDAGPAPGEGFVCGPGWRRCGRLCEAAA
ncbi:MAG TPA: ferrochelatase [Caulobacteraceae bacterium]|nr:ferrochelatase [Caulobacteraceae bacterium]